MTVIVVGVDGSDGSLQALDWAAEEAASTGRTLRVVHAWFEPVVVAYPFAAGAAFETAAIEEAAEVVLEQGVDRARRAHPDLRIERALVHGTAATVVLAEAGKADLVVVGSRGRGGFAGLLLGSVSQQVVHHAPCPVVIVPHTTPSES